MSGHTYARCRTCHAPILWTRTEHGKRMPLDALPIADFRCESGGLFVLRETDQPTPLAIAAWGLEGTEPHFRYHVCTERSAA